MATLTVAALAASSRSATDASLGGTTASITPTANGLLVCGVAVKVGGGGFTVASVSGLSLTWTLLASNFYDPNQCVAVFSAPAGASPGSGQLTITLSGTGAGNPVAYSVVQVTGAANGWAVPNTKNSPYTPDFVTTVTYAQPLPGPVNTDSKGLCFWAASRGVTGGGNWTFVNGGGLLDTLRISCHATGAWDGYPTATNSTYTDLFSGAALEIADVAATPAAKPGTATGIG